MKQIRFLRLLLFFDVATKTKRQRKEYVKFRNFLLDDGYQMVQWSVYMRVCKGVAAVDKHKKRLLMYLPRKGNVRTLVITNSEYEKMDILVGIETEQEKQVGNKQLLLF